MRAYSRKRVLVNLRVDYGRGDSVSAAVDYRLIGKQAMTESDFSEVIRAVKEKSKAKNIFITSYQYM